MTNQLQNFTHVVFAFDLTLAELLVDWTEWYVEVKKVGQKFDPTFGVDEKVNYEMMNKLIKTHGQKARLEILAFWQKYELANVSGAKPIEPALKALKNLASHQKAYLLTSNTKPTVLPILAELEIAHLFQRIIAQEDIEFFKPHSYAFTLIQDGQTPLSKYVMVGDSKNDEGFARNAGISFIHVDELK
jgi:phosphoglycolate phosphatase-like HAD superfamily hydrolase